MEKIYSSVDKIIGNTPLLRLSNIESAYKLQAELVVKLEYLNPAGSAKDRVALRMIEDAEEKGIISKGATLIEPTSGNTGIGLAMVAAAKGYRAVIVMPDSMSPERIAIMRAYGAEVVLTPGKEGMAGAIAKAEALAAATPGSFIPGQFSNPSNPAAHEMTTGPEIFRDTDGKIDIFVAGIGTGGTVSGVGRYLKANVPGVKTVGVEPFDSPFITEGRAGAHKLQGIGAGFVPDNYDPTAVDEVVTATAEESYAAARALAALEGILVGISSGAAAAVAIRLAAMPENRGKRIVVLLPDTGDRYLSTDLFER